MPWRRYALWENILQDPSRRTGNIFAIFLECQANLRESAHVASHKFLWTWHAIAGSKNNTNTTPHITPNEITTRQNKNTPAFGKSEDESSRTSSVNYLPVGSHHNIPGMKSQPNERINIGWKGSALPNHSSIHWNARLQPGDSIFVRVMVMHASSPLIDLYLLKVSKSDPHIHHDRNRR